MMNEGKEDNQIVFIFVFSEGKVIKYAYEYCPKMLLYKTILLIAKWN